MRDDGREEAGVSLDWSTRGRTGYRRRSRVHGAALAKITESVDLMRTGCERGSAPDSSVYRGEVEFLSSVEKLKSERASAYGRVRVHVYVRECEREKEI